ncbi:MAG: hypothetical protein JWO98_4738 [Frankiales bacterium]|nr:hypothetical protein [Frankiales bacterium]
MTSLRAAIEAKARRTHKLPILVGDALAATKRVAEATEAFQRHMAAQAEEGAESDDEAGQALREELTAAMEAHAQTVVLVEIQALPSDEWDAIFAPIEPDADGEISLDECRAVLMAASCTDPELQDVVWWEQQFARPEWSKGDKLAINNALLELNHHAPTGPLGKG